MKNRSELREIIMKALYQINIYEEAKVEYDIENIKHDLLEVENSFVDETIEGIIKNKNKLIELANKYLNNWTIDRLNKVDQSILLIGIYELMYTETPSIVSIN